MTNLIVGFGTTGKSIKRYLERNNETFFVFDDFQEIPENLQFKESNFENINRVIISPGIKPDHWILATARKLNITITTDIEIFANLNKIKLVGITGTNGKTTFVHYLSEILNNKGFVTTTAGNIGVSPLDLIETDKNYDYIILELSSFQLEYLNNIQLEIAIITNIFEDHIDWHKNFNNYAESKLKILKFVKENSNLYIGELDKRLSLEKKFEKNKITMKKYNHKNFYDEFINLMVQVCEKFKINEDDILKILNDAPQMEHRFEKFFVNDTTIFINDSKSTNFQSVFKATTKVSNALLILHGLTKDIDYRTFQISDNVKEIILPTYMEDLKKLNNINNFKITTYTKFEELKKILFEKSNNYEFVLFSCGGSSFNEFKNYKERGEKFKELVIGILS